MYAIYAYIDPQNHPNVGIYGIHGVSGIRKGFAQFGTINPILPKAVRPPVAPTSTEPASVGTAAPVDGQL